MTDDEIRALVERLNAVQPLDFSPHAIPVELCAEAAAALTALMAERNEAREELLCAREECEEYYTHLFERYWGPKARRAAFARAKEIVNTQAEDDGLWFVAQTAPEAYLQQELRRLHAAIEVEMGEK